MDKRSFLKSLTFLGIGAGSIQARTLDTWIKSVEHLPADEVAKNEDFWEVVRGDYKLKTDYINLENGYYCFMPQETLESYIRHVREVNVEGSYYMRTVQETRKRQMAGALCAIAGCSPDELIITRNTTESLDTIISGMNWKAGDEAVMAEQDYGAMLDMFKLMAKRHGIVNKIVSLPIDPKSDEEIVNLYANVITPKTKLLMVCHMVNITGQILPVKKISEMAHSKGVEVMVDGAHAFAHIRYSIPDLGCDYYGASLHKWLSVPLGAGILYVKRENIGKVWPLIADGDGNETNIYRLNHTGTHPVHTDLTIADAVRYYNKIGGERKEARLKYLQQYWTTKVRAIPHAIVNTPVDPARSCGIANVGVKGMKPSVLAKTLMDKYKIFTVAIDNANVQGCRITPNLYTTTEDLDALVSAIQGLG